MKLGSRPDLRRRGLLGGALFGGLVSLSSDGRLWLSPHPSLLPWMPIGPTTERATAR